MRLGVDFGTTRTIVAVADRGNYPVVAFEDPVGDSHDFVPSVAAWHDGGLVFGHSAVHAWREHRAPVARSFKRLLGAPTVNADTPVGFGDVQVPLIDVLTGFLAALAGSLREHSTLAGRLDGPLQAAVAVPAHAYGAQRFLTLHAFRAAGFEVTAMLNEPSAAGFEYTHRHARTVTANRTRVIVYDLGGGTFDASLVGVRGTRHDVTASVGLNHLGGDDFDLALATCALAAAGRADAAADAELLEECRDAKERLTPQSRRVVVDVDEAPVSVPVDGFYASTEPLVEATFDAMAPLVGRLDDGSPDLTEVAGIYLVGGGSALPVIPRRLRERFGRRVHTSPYPAASTAIGLAIAADEESGYTLEDRLSRGFGVFREGGEGTEISFDELIGRDERVSADHAVELTRCYRAAHNLGWFRFVEYADLDVRGEPKGELVPFAELVFPFDPELQDGRDLRGIDVIRPGHGPLVEERYVIDRHGIVEVRITDLDTGFSQVTTLETSAG